jgi:hypothetical protein
LGVSFRKTGVFSLAVFLGIIIGAVLLLRKQKRKN